MCHTRRQDKAASVRARTSVRIGRKVTRPGEIVLLYGPHASTYASTTSVCGSQNVISMAREVLHECGGASHEFLGSGGMRLWAGPWRHALLYASLPPPSPPGPLGMRRAPVGGHTDADTRGHTPHERTRRLLVIPPSVLAHAEETGPAPGSTVPHGRGGHREPPSNLPTMVVAFGGWIDAGEAATGALALPGPPARGHTAGVD